MWAGGPRWCWRAPCRPRVPGWSTSSRTSRGMWPGRPSSGVYNITSQWTLYPVPCAQPPAPATPGLADVVRCAVEPRAPALAAGPGLAPAGGKEGGPQPPGPRHPLGRCVCGVVVVPTKRCLLAPSQQRIY